MTTTRFPNGMTTAAKSDTLGQFVLPDSTTAHTYMEDYDYYIAAEWTIGATGSPTIAQLDFDGGAVRVSGTGGSGSNFGSLSKTGANFKPEIGKEMWFKARLLPNSVGEQIVLAGLQAPNTDPFVAATSQDGIFLKNNSVADTLSLFLQKDGNETEFLLGDMPALSEFEIGWHFDGIETIKGYLNDKLLGTALIDSNFPDDAVLSPTWGTHNNSATARALTVDYLFAAKER